MLILLCRLMDQDLYLTTIMFIILIHTVERIENCLNGGGTIKPKCEANEITIVDGCFNPHFCCCGFKDGGCFLFLARCFHCLLSTHKQST